MTFCAALASANFFWPARMVPSGIHRWRQKTSQWRIFSVQPLFVTPVHHTELKGEGKNKPKGQALKHVDCRSVGGKQVIPSHRRAGLIRQEHNDVQRLPPHTQKRISDGSRIDSHITEARKQKK
jgi:hypothetical protein